MATTGHESEAINVQGLKASLQKLKTDHIDGKIASTEKGAASGVATLGSDGKVPSSQLPSYVDDVLEYANKSSFPATGDGGKIYVDKSNNTTWRWSGSAYTQIKGDIVIGTTSGTAADGGTANTHYNNTSNPHSVTKSQVGLGSVVNTGDSATPVSGGTTKFTTGGAYTELAKKVDKVSGKGLSTNDYTTDDKNKLAGIAAGAEVNVQSDWNATSGDAQILNKPTIPAAVAVKGNAETNYRTGNVNITPANIGLGNVGNFKAVSTAASQGLTATEQANARTNIASVGETINTTWAELKTLRDNSQLVPCQWYRITDYECTTMQEDTRSAGNVFDIIVRADANNILNENAYAAKHSGDTYFSAAGAKLEAWELKYCIDNDSRRFLWAKTNGGKGVIYWMKDEWDNECPYDFKNILFPRYRVTECEKVPSLEGSFSAEGANGVTVDTDTTYWCYTFCMIDTDDNSAHDLTVEQGVYLSDEGFTPINRCNVFKPYYLYSYHDEELDENYQIMSLPNNVMVTDTEICHIEDGYGEFYGYYNNTFGYDCYNNTIGNNFNSNSIGNNCYYNTIVNNFGNNSIGNYFSENSIGEFFLNNTIGNGFYNNSIGTDCYRNSIGNEVYNNSIGNGFYNNSIGNNCYDNSIGEYFQNNTIGNDFNSNSIGNCFNSNSIGNGCQSIRIQKDFVYYIIIENGNQYIDITSTQTTSDSNELRNFTVAQGVNNGTTRKTISHNSVNDTFKTTYQNASSTTVNV